MWKPQHLTALWVSTARYRDIFTLYNKDKNDFGYQNLTEEEIAQKAEEDV
jgi:hypothetical protein